MDGVRDDVWQQVRISQLSSAYDGKSNMNCGYIEMDVGKLEYIGLYDWMFGRNGVIGKFTTTCFIRESRIPNEERLFVI